MPDVPCGVDVGWALSSPFEIAENFMVETYLRATSSSPNALVGLS